LLVAAPYAKNPAVQEPPGQRSGRPTAVIFLLTLLLLLLLGAAYVGVMHALVELSEPDSGTDIDRRDLAYTYVHLVLLLGAAIIGFLAGKWFNGLGLAFATLFVVVTVVVMLGVQMGSYELACRGHNDLVRHWQC
jgi:hypothetical protein